MNQACLQMINLCTQLVIMKYDETRKKTAIITGGAGFIGSSVAKRLISEGYSVLIIDNLFRGVLSNLKEVLVDNNKLYKIDITDDDAVDKISEIIIEFKPELIMHYAAINGTQYFYDEPAKVATVNSLGTLNLMKSVKVAENRLNNFHPRIFFASTSEVYGEPSSIPTKETDLSYVRIDEDRDSYAAAKLMSEFYVRLYSKELGIPFVILRIFNVFGPRMIGTKYGQVIPEFIERLLRKEYPLNILGDGLHTRSFCFIDDHVELTIKLIKSGIANDVINLGNPNEISILELATLLMKKLDLVPDFKFLEERQGDHLRRNPDITKLLSAVGGFDFTSLDAGLIETINYYKKKTKNEI